MVYIKYIDIRGYGVGGKRSLPVGNTTANHLCRAVRGWDRCLVTDRREGGGVWWGPCHLNQSHLFPFF
ncbi:hypothetical protein Hanom_Chr03g00277691 [Helianthus anomalus]